MRPLRKLCSFGRDDRGSVAIIVGLLLVFIIGVAGASIDLGRQQMVKNKLQQASDAAALAAANMPDGTAESVRTTEAAMFFALNVPDPYNGVSPRPTPNVTFPSGSVRVTAQTNVPTNFMKFLGSGLVASSAGSSVLIEQNAQTTYDVLLVMDNSGSMATADIGAGGSREMPSGLRSTARTEARQSCYNWPTNVGICNSHGDGPRAVNPPPYGFGLTGATRLNAVRLAARTITTELLNPNEAGNRVGIVTWAHNLIDSEALTTNFTTAANAIDSMWGWGATNSLVGMQRAQTLGNDFDEDHVRAIILLTDGMNTWGSPGCNGADYCSGTDTSTNNLCTTLKNQGIVIYTVAFGTDVTTGSQATQAQNFLRNCASRDADNNPRFFIAPNSSVLQTAFGDILTSIQKLRISD